MWEEELDIIINDGGYHDIDYQLKNGDVVSFMVRGVRYNGKYCIYAESRTYSDNSYWLERNFTISKIQAIDNVPYKQSIGYLNYLRKLEEEKRKKDKKNSKTSSTNPELEAKAGCLGFFGMAGFIAGAAMGGGVGAFIGIILGSLFALWFYDYRFNN